MEQSQHAVTKEMNAPTRWMHWRDLGVMDQHGYVTITGQSKDMVIISGENICPREIEERGGRLNAAHTAGVAGSAVLPTAP